MFRQFALVVVLVLIVATPILGIAQQQLVATANLPEAPSYSSSLDGAQTPFNSLVSSARANAPQKRSFTNGLASAFRPSEPKDELLAHHGFWQYFDPRPRSIKETVQWAGFTADVVSTVQFLDQPEWYNGVTPHGQIFSYKGRFYEAGPSTWIGIPNRNMPAIVGGAFLTDFSALGLGRLARTKLETSHGKRKILWKLAAHAPEIFGLIHGLSGSYNLITTPMEVKRVEQITPIVAISCWQNVEATMVAGILPSEVCK